MAYAAWSVVAGEQPTAAKWNILGTNDASFNDGSGIAYTVNNTVPANALSTSAIKLGSASTTTTFSTASATAVQVTGLTITITVPSGSRSVLLLAWARALYNTTANTQVIMSIWDGVVGSGTQISESYAQANASASTGSNASAFAFVTPAAGSKTYNVGLLATAGGTANLQAGATFPALLLALAI